MIGYGETLTKEFAIHACLVDVIRGGKGAKDSVAITFKDNEVKPGEVERHLRVNLIGPQIKIARKSKNSREGFTISMPNTNMQLGTKHKSPATVPS